MIDGDKFSVVNLSTYTSSLKTLKLFIESLEETEAELRDVNAHVDNLEYLGLVETIDILKRIYQGFERSYSSDVSPSKIH